MVDSIKTLKDGTVEATGSVARKLFEIMSGTKLPTDEEDHVSKVRESRFKAKVVDPIPHSICECI